LFPFRLISPVVYQ